MGKKRKYKRKRKQKKSLKKKEGSGKDETYFLRTRGMIRKIQEMKEKRC